MNASLFSRLQDALEHVEPEAIRAYELNTLLLINTVIDTIKKREDLADLVGPNPLYLMEQKLSYHTNAIASQLKIKSARTLVENLVWIYRMCINRGFSPTYFYVELTAWKEALRANLDQKSADQIGVLYQSLLEGHRDFLFLSQSPTAKVDTDEPLRSYFNRYMEALLKPDVRGAIEVSREYIQTVWDIPVWWEQIILPAMYEIGRLWSEGDITVGQEHMASSITQRIISTYYPLILELPRTKGAVVVAVTPDELHEIGARMVADLLEMHGWDVYYTGANTPTESLLSLIQQQQAHYLCLSTTIPSHLAYVSDIIAQVRQSPFSFPVHILVGGQAYMSDQDIWKKVGADGFVSSASQSVHYLQSLHPTNGDGTGYANGNGHAQDYDSSSYGKGVA